MCGGFEIECKEGVTQSGGLSFGEGERNGKSFRRSPIEATHRRGVHLLPPPPSPFILSCAV